MCFLIVFIWFIYCFYNDLYSFYMIVHGLDKVLYGSYTVLYGFYKALCGLYKVSHGFYNVLYCFIRFHIVFIRFHIVFIKFYIHTRKYTHTQSLQDRGAPSFLYLLTSRGPPPGVSCVRAPRGEEAGRHRRRRGGRGRRPCPKRSPSNAGHGNNP